ncbi:hypothetical protein NHF40_10185 [Maricaulaceae bacterium EIL42A08]|nr:hypothetical protein [Maricaulaceae bacterium EIL42A08]
MSSLVFETHFSGDAMGVFGDLSANMNVRGARSLFALLMDRASAVTVQRVLDAP